MPFPFQELFQGRILNLPPSQASRELGGWAREVVDQEWGEAPELLGQERFREALGRARARIAGPDGRELVKTVLVACDVPLAGLLLDHLRLRAIAPGLEQIPEAAPAFYVHRDTWYANPKAQINGWLPLVPVDSSNSFRFFLDDFERPVANDSETFEAEDFQSRGGFGRTTADPTSAYPRALETSDSRVWDVAMPTDGVLFFSAAHLHGPLANRSGKVRFSVDFRFLREADLHSGAGARDPDNRSRGCVAASYQPC
jgi:hypothetical protein